MLESGTKEMTTKAIYSQTRKLMQLARDKLDSSKYSDFVEALCLFHSGTSDRATTLRAIRRVLYRFPLLRERMTQLLPETSQPDSNRAAEYMEKIKEQGADVYDPFVEALGKYQVHEISFQTLMDEAERILGPYPELFDGFLEFSPTEQPAEGGEVQAAGTDYYSPEHKEDQDGTGAAAAAGVSANNAHSHFDHSVAVAVSAEPIAPVPATVMIEDSHGRFEPLPTFEGVADETAFERNAFVLIKDALKDIPGAYLGIIKCVELYAAVCLDPRSHNRKHKIGSDKSERNNWAHNAAA